MRDAAIATEALTRRYHAALNEVTLRVPWVPHSSRFCDEWASPKAIFAGCFYPRRFLGTTAKNSSGHNNQGNALVDYYVRSGI